MSSQHTNAFGHGAEAYQPAIDGLRALAVVSVIVNHYLDAILPSGYLGVDVFYVISGYVITLALVKRQERSIGHYLFDFYCKRIRRLIPALLVMVLVSSAVIRLFDPDPVASMATGIASLFGASNLFLYLRAIDYFGEAVRLNPLSHTWSLGVEEQYYLLYPVLLRWCLRRRTQSASSNLMPLAVVGGLVVISCAAFLFVYPLNQPAAYYLTPFRFWELGAGGLAALYGGRIMPKAPARWRPAAELTCFVLLIAVLFAPMAHAMLATILVVTFTTGLVTTLSAGSHPFAILASAPAAYVGRLSYSLYLWHWPVICVSLWTVGVHAGTWPLLLALTVGLSALSYHFIERPIRYGVLAGRNKATMALGLSALCITAALIALEHKTNVPRFSGSSVETEAGAAIAHRYVGKWSGRRVEQCFAEAVFTTDARADRPNLLRCSAINGSRTLIAFAGDSHALDMFPLAEDLFHDGTASVINVYQPGCRAPPLAGEAASCAYLTRLLGALSDSSGGTRVLVLRNNYAPRHIDGSLGEFAARLEALVDLATSMNVKVVYVAPAPKYAGVGPASFCSVQWFRPSWSVSSACGQGLTESRQEQLARRRDLTTYLARLGREREGFYVFDPFEPLCGGDAKSCTPLRDGALIYRDDSHLTQEGSELLTPSFRDFLRTNGLLNPR